MNVERKPIYAIKSVQTLMDHTLVSAEKDSGWKWMDVVALVCFTLDFSLGGDIYCKASYLHVVDCYKGVLQ